MKTTYLFKFENPETGEYYFRFATCKKPEKTNLYKNWDTSDFTHLKIYPIRYQLAKEALNFLYLDWFNNLQTLKKFKERHNIKSLKAANKIINLGRKINHGANLKAYNQFKNI